ncbi:hypothetical protein D3C72_1260430 [compost metagenome]
MRARAARQQIAQHRHALPGLDASAIAFAKFAGTAACVLEIVDDHQVGTLENVLRELRLGRQDRAHGIEMAAIAQRCRIDKGLLGARDQGHDFRAGQRLFQAVRRLDGERVAALRLAHEFRALFRRGAIHTYRLRLANRGQRRELGDRLRSRTNQRRMPWRRRRQCARGQARDGRRA